MLMMLTSSSYEELFIITKFLGVAARTAFFGTMTENLESQVHQDIEDDVLS